MYISLNAQFYLFVLFYDRCRSVISLARGYGGILKDAVYGVIL